MTQHYVDPNKVFVIRAHEGDIISCMRLLQAEGQIVPLMVKPYTDIPVYERDYEWVADQEDDLYAGARVMAARRLHWPTILVEDTLVESG